jgi:hypothetical protein
VLELSQYALMAGLLLVALALVCYILVLTLGRSVRRTPVMGHAGGTFGAGADYDAGRVAEDGGAFGNLFFGGLHSHAK